jgi:DnaK suppressor protein
MNETTNGRKRAAGAEGAQAASRPSAPIHQAPAHAPAHAEPPKPPPTRHAEGPEIEALTAAQVAELRDILERKRTELVTSIEGRRGEERDAGREVGDEMDEANTEGASAMASKLLERDVQLLRDIDRALAKMTDGEFGLCEGTGEPIGYSRLKLRPWARFSVEYQEELERAQRGRGGV